MYVNFYIYQEDPYALPISSFSGREAQGGYL